MAIVGKRETENQINSLTILSNSLNKIFCIPIANKISKTSTNNARKHIIELLLLNVRNEDKYYELINELNKLDEAITS